MRYCFYGIILSVGIFSSCQESDQVNKSRISMIQSIVDTELKGVFELNKIITSNGTSQQKIDTLDQMASEFSLWLKYIPSKDQLSEDFECEKKQKESGTEYVYTPKESKKDLTSYIVCKDLNGQIIWLSAHVQDEQDLFYSEYQLRWNIEKNEYSIYASEGIAHSREIRYSIQGKYSSLSK